MTDDAKDREQPERLLDSIDSPADLRELSDEQLQQVAQEVRELIIDTIGEIGGHFGANLGTCELAVALHSLLDSPTRQDPLGRRAPGLSAQGSHRPARPARHDPPVRGAGPVLLGVRVRARHHGRGPRLDLDRLRGRPEGGDAQGDRRGRQGRRRDRRRGAHRRRRLRGAPSRRRAADADGDRPQRQRDVDLAERRRDLALLPARPAQPPPLPGALDHRGAPHPAAARPRPADRAAGPRGEGGDQGVLRPGPLLRGARPRLRGRDRRPRRRRAARRPCRKALDAERPGRGPHPHRQGQGVRARRGGRPRGHGEVARRQARLDRRRQGGPEEACRAGERIGLAGEDREAREAAAQVAAAVHGGLRRRPGRGGQARPAGDRDHRRDGGRDGAQQARARRCPSSTTTSASPSRTRSCSPPASRSRARSRSARSTRPSCSAPSTSSSTTSACRS